MLEPSIDAALNRQMNQELHSSYPYLAMSAHYDASNLSGFDTRLRARARRSWPTG